MQKLLFASALTIMIAAVTAACTEPDATIVDGAIEQSVDESVITLFGSAGIDRLPNDATERDHRAALKRYGEVRAAVIDAISAGGSVDAIDARVHSVVAESGTYSYRPYLEQYAASRLLELWLKEDAPTAVSWIEAHASTLLRYSNPDASLLRSALTALRQVWPEAEIREAARKTALAARRWSQKVCPDCHEKGGADRVESNTALSRKRAAVIEATDALDLLAGP